jgi:hypothetical protein
MPLLNDHLTLWEIAFRWNSLNPDSPKYHFYLPLKVKDSFRLMVDNILNANLVSSLSLDKWRPDSNSPSEFYIRSHIDDIYHCIGNIRYKRKLLKFIYIERYDFEKWSRSQNIPLPEFWFPTGWLTHPDETSFDSDDTLDDEKDRKLRTNQRSKIACQEIAIQLWKDSPEMTIASMIDHPDVKLYGKSDHYTKGVVRNWLSEIAPEHVKNRRGRPPKNDN